MVTTRTFAQRCTKLALDTDLQKFMQLCPADMQAHILSTYADARELRSEQGYEIEQLQLCYAL